MKILVIICVVRVVKFIFCLNAELVESVNQSSVVFFVVL